MSAKCFLVVAAAAVLSIANARSVDLNLCSDITFNCQCGTPGYVFPITVRQCTGFYRWRPQCRPCNKETEPNTCVNYRNCLDCELGKCTRCPNGKFGTWCTGVCQCQNDAKCRKSDGKCICVEDFEGQFCERRISTPATASSSTVTCPVPEPIDNGDLQVTNGNYVEPTVGTSIKYICHSNHIVIGSIFNICTQTGNWTSPAPRCISVQNLTSLFDSLSAQ